MRTRLVVLVVLLALVGAAALVSGCGSEGTPLRSDAAATVNPWAGGYGGSYSGGYSGTWTATVSSAGRITAIVKRPHDSVTLTGNVSLAGSFKAVNGSGWMKGQFRKSGGKRVCSGTWQDPQRKHGTFAGSQLPGTGTVTGSLWVSSGGRFVPLGGQLVRIVGTHAAVSAPATGRFTLTGVPAGVFHIIVSAPAYGGVLNPASLTGSVSAGHTTNVGRILIGPAPPPG